MERVLIITLFILRFCTLPAQDLDQIPHLRKQLNASQKSTEQLETLLSLAELYNSANRSDSCLYYALQAQQLAQKQAMPLKKAWADYFVGENLLSKDIEKGLRLLLEAEVVFEKYRDEKGLTLLYNRKADYEANQGRNDQARQYYRKSLEYNRKYFGARDTLRYRKNQGGIYNNIALSYRNEGDYLKAIEYTHKSSKIGRAIGHSGLEFLALTNLGILHSHIQQDEKGKDFYEQALKLAREIDNPLYLGVSLSNLGNYYTAQQEFDQAISFYREALAIAKAQEDNRRAGIRLMNIGALYVIKENYPAAEQHFLRARDYIEQVKAWPIKAKVLQNLAELHYRQGHLDEAEKWVKAAIQLNQKISNLESIHKNYLTWHDIESKRGNYPQALEHYQKYATLKDSLLNERNLAKLEELQAKYETEKKEEAIADLSQQNQIQSLQLDQRNLWIALLAIALVLISSLIVILYRQRLLREKNQALRIKQKLLRTQINPHFFFNVLSNIQSMFLEQTDAQKTTYYLSKFAKLMRSVLENSREEVISLEEEMHMLESYLEIQKLRFGEKLCYSIEYDQSLDPRETALPPMLAQPFIENSLEHGILNKEGVGKVEIRFWKEQNQLFFSVIDNGIGRSQATQVGQKKGIVSLATTITRERLEVLNRTWKKALGFKIQDLWDEQENPSGTQVIFNIPLVKL